MSFFNSRRSNVVAANGMVATSQPLAARAGLRVLEDGGNAVDAAVCCAAALSVVEPMSTGLGGDVFALVWDAQARKVFALNGSGQSAGGANLEDVQRLGLKAIPLAGDGSAMSVSTPGTVAGWEDLVKRFGSMDLKRLLRPAIEYAEKGFAVTELISSNWEASTQKLRHRPSGNELLKDGRAPKFGEWVSLPELGKSLAEVAEGGAEAFYKGPIAEKICNYVQAEGGWLALDDMVSHRSEWVEPISADYHGTTVWECPPNGQGIAALIALNIVAGYDVKSFGHLSSDWYHYLSEAMRLAFTDTFANVADPGCVAVDVERLLSQAHSEQRRAMIGTNSMGNPGGWTPNGGEDTVYLTVVDKDGNACSLINSLFYGFGSGLVAPTTGIALQNRGALFELNATHPNRIAGNKRPYHTIIPAMATRDDELWLSFGVMGGFQQPQGHLQVISNMVDFDMSPQAALDSPRFSVDVRGGGNLLVEEDIDSATLGALRKRGHKVEVKRGRERMLFGGGQIIARDPKSGVLVAGSEPRKDGLALGF